MRLRFRRLYKTKQGRKKLRFKIWIFVKRNALVGSVILLTVQITNERSWRRLAEKEAFEVKKENSFIRGVVSMRNSDFQTFPLPWWEKIKRQNSWRFLDLNPAYELEYKFIKTKSLGKSNEEFFGENVGHKYSDGDFEVWTKEDRQIMRIEPLTNGKDVFVFKYGRISVLGDSISSGFSIPFEKILILIEDYKIKKNNLK